MQENEKRRLRLLVGSVELAALDLVVLHVDTEPDVVVESAPLVDNVLEVGRGGDLGGSASQMGKDFSGDLIRGSHGGNNLSRVNTGLAVDSVEFLQKVRK